MSALTTAVRQILVLGVPPFIWMWLSLIQILNHYCYYLIIVAFVASVEPGPVLARKARTRLRVPDEMLIGN